MRWQDWLGLFLGSGALLTALISLLTVALQNRNAHRLLEKQRLADLERLSYQLAAEKEGRLRAEAREALERHLGQLEAYCQRMVEIVTAILDRRGQANVDELCLGSTQARIGALVSADALDDRRIREAVDAILAKTQEALAATLQEPGKQLGLAETPALEALEWIGVAQALVTQTRGEVIRDPFSRLAGLGFLGPRQPRGTERNNAA